MGLPARTTIASIGRFFYRGIREHPKSIIACIILLCISVNTLLYLFYIAFTPDPWFLTPAEPVQRGEIVIPNRKPPPKWQMEWIHSRTLDPRETGDLKKEIVMDLVYTWVNGSEPELETMKAHYQALSPLFKNLKKLPEKHNRPGRQHGRGRGRKRDLGADQTMNRFRDMNELKYSVRSVAQYATSGMFRKIFILTTEVVNSVSGNKRGQVPQWLDREKAKGMVELVPHRMVYDDENFLPSFNSLSIESQIHHIPGMADIVDLFQGKRGSNG